MTELPTLGDLLQQIEALRADKTRLRAETIEECVTAARKGFEEAMGQYVLIGPSGMAMRMINSIKALDSP
jgi:hydrogenase maturation factor